MSRLSLVLVLCLASLAAARMAYVLPAGAEGLLRSGTVKESFSCESRPYGYYADVDNDCELFHVCLPVPRVDSDIPDMAQFTFVCGNQTVFNQESLICSHPDDAMPCEDAPALYDFSNSFFGVVPETTISPE